MNLATHQLDRLRMFTEDLRRIGSEAQLWEILDNIETPLELFYVPWLLNWDDPRTEKVIAWVLKSDLCDAGTALAVYWLACPGDWAGQEVDPDGDEWENDQIAFFRELERRINVLDFPSQELSYDPRESKRFWSKDGIERQELSEIPEWMKKASPGIRPRSLHELNL